MDPLSPPVSLIGRLKGYIKAVKQRARPTSSRYEYFTNASKFAINGGQFISVNQLTQNNITPSEREIFDLLKQEGCLDATKDSRARHPPPKCHPRTRLRIRERLKHWLINEELRMLWVFGSTGTGKSAVAQSFAHSCEQEGNLAGTYFFSGGAGRKKPETVVPTLVYQLATSVPEYRSFLAGLLSQGHLQLQDSLPVQFQKLIVEPFSAPQLQHLHRPMVIILDGLEEYEGEDSQREILRTITNAIRTHPSLPLRWLIFSRPEAHLKYAFSKNPLCGCEELMIDAECKEDVERYVMDSLGEIKDEYHDIVPPEWPSPKMLQELLDAASGLFVLASTCIDYIADRGESDPPSQLHNLLTFLSHPQDAISKSPLAPLDLLYAQILENVRPAEYKTVRRILAYITHQDKLDKHAYLGSAQALVNFLQLDKRVLYKNARGLFSVVRIPEIEDAAKYPPHFYHSSFQDFILDPNRSGKFSITEQEALEDIVRSGIHWYEVDATHFHSPGGWYSERSHKHNSLPGLTWVSENEQLSCSQAIMNFLGAGLFDFHLDIRLRVVTDELLRQLSNLDFRYWSSWDVFLLVRICQLDPSGSVVRTTPSSPTDQQLLECFNRLIGDGIAKPATFPLRYPLLTGRWIRDYFFIGHGVKSVIVWVMKSPTSNLKYAFSLNCDQEPSEAQISMYQASLESIKWDEAKARLEME